MVYIRKSLEGNLNFGAKKEIFVLAKELRKSETDAEKKLWKALRNRRCSGLKFRRQHPVKEFIIDFYCHEYFLGIEVDGSVHDNECVKEYDLHRQAEIEYLGINLIRFTDEEVLTSISTVLYKIMEKVKDLQNSERLKTGF